MCAGQTVSGAEQECRACVLITGRVSVSNARNGKVLRNVTQCTILFSKNILIAMSIITVHCGYFNALSELQEMLKKASRHVS